MSTRTLDIKLAVSAISQPFGVVWGRVREGISELTEAQLEITTMEDIDFSVALSGDARVEVLLDGTSARRWSLKVASVDYLRVENGALRFLVDLRAPLWLLRHTKDTRKFRNMSAQDIVSKVLSEHGVPFAFRTVRATPVRKYCTQYRESCLDFVLRLLEFEGIYFTLDDDGVMILEDRSPGAGPVDGPTSSFELLDAAGALARDELGIHEIERGAAVASGKASVNDFNWKRPKLELLRGRAAGRDAELETYDYPAGYRKPEQGEHLAQIKLEAHRVAAQYVEGRGDVVGFAPARRFSFGSSAGDLFAGDYLLVGVEHEAHDPHEDGGVFQRIYENRFRAIPLSTPFRAKMRTPRPDVGGCHTAMVRGPAGEEIHTDEFGRFRAQFHWDREAVGTDDDSRWLRALQETATGMVLARVGWEVTVAYIDGDPDRPIGIARNINGAMVPTYGQPDHQNVMTIMTPSSPATGGFNEIKLDDSAGKMLFYQRAERDFLTWVRHDRTETIGRDETHTVEQDLTRAVERDQTTTIGSSSKTTVGGDSSVTVTRDRSRTVGGSETIDVGAQLNASTHGDETETVGSVRLTIAGGVKLPKPKIEAPKPPGLDDVKKAAIDGALKGGVQGAVEGVKGLIPTPEGLMSQMTGGLSDGISLDKLVNQLCHGSISRRALTRMNRTVGGAFVTVAASDIQKTARAHAELVGGAKVTLVANGSIAETVTGSLEVAIGALALRTAGTDIGYGTKLNSVNVGLAASVVAGESFEVFGDDIRIVARSSLVLDVNGVLIDMKPDSVTMKGVMVLESEGTVTVTGSKENITA